MNGVRVPLALSLAGHAAFLAALVLLATVPPHRPTVPPLRGIELILTPPALKPAPAPRPPHRTAPAPPKPAAVRPPPRPVPPPAKPKPLAVPPSAHPPVPAVAKPPPRLRRPPVIRRTVRPIPRRPPRFVHPEEIVPRRTEPLRRRPVILRRSWRYARPEPIVPRYMPPPIPAPAIPRTMPPQRFAAPPAAPAPAATVTPGYRALLLDWLETHKYYPETARERDEEGTVLLRFRIDRSGRVLDCTVARSSGYADLDDAAMEMMRGAVLSPFPPSMPEQSLEIAVPIRFGLR